MEASENRKNVHVIDRFSVDVFAKKVIISGQDTHHDTATKDGSFGVFLVALNMTYSKSRAGYLEGLDEISSEISVNIVEVLKQYMECHNDEPPERIIIYRDGVRDGQLEHVSGVEWQKIREALSHEAPRALVTMVVVKRIMGSRFYMRPDADDSFLNPPPETDIDNRATQVEFTRQKPETLSSYDIIHDENTFTPTIHEKLASELCRLYSPKLGPVVSVSVPGISAPMLASLQAENLPLRPNFISLLVAPSEQPTKQPTNEKEIQ